jgi:hypothetical protein
VLLRVLDRLDRGRDAHVARVELAPATDRAAERDHRQRPERDPVCAHAVQLHDVVRVPVAAVGPDLYAVADPRFHQRAMHGARPDVGREADVAQSVLARRPGPALEP